MKFAKSLVFALSAVAATSQAAISIQIIPALAPNAYGSINWDTWVANATHGIEFGQTTVGTPGTPGYYEALANQNLYVSQNCVTSFPSWLGKADPGTAFGTQFSAEYGNRLHFGLHIFGNGQKISISMLSFSATSSDPGNYLGFSFGTGDYGYSSNYYGIDYGPDGVKGGGDDTYIYGGASNQLVDEIVGRGSGNAFWPDYGDPVMLPPTQATIDAFVKTMPNMFMTGTYKLTDGPTVIASASAKVHFKKG